MGKLIRDFLLVGTCTQLLHEITKLYISNYTFQTKHFKLYILNYTVNIQYTTIKKYSKGDSKPPSFKINNVF